MPSLALSIFGRDQFLLPSHAETQVTARLDLPIAFEGVPDSSDAATRQSISRFGEGRSRLALAASAALVAEFLPRVRSAAEMAALAWVAPLPKAGLAPLRGVDDRPHGHSNDEAVAYVCKTRPPRLDVRLITGALQCRQADADPDSLFHARTSLPSQVDACAALLTGLRR